MAFELAFHGFCGIFCRILSHFSIREHDLHRYVVGVYHRLRRGHGLALHSAQYAAGFSMPGVSAISYFGDFGMSGDDDVVRFRNLVALGDLADYRIDHLFYV